MLKEAVVQTCPVKKVSLEISQNSQENICFRDSFSCALAVKPPTNHPKTSQITHKPAKLPTNQSNHPQITHKLPTSQPNHSQTSQIPNKSPTNQPKIASSFPWRHFLWTATFSLPIPREKRNRCIFFCSCWISHFAFSIAQFFTIPNCRLQS